MSIFSSRASIRSSSGWLAVALAGSLSVLPVSAQMPGQRLPGLTPETVTQTAHGLHAVAGSEVMDVTVCTDSVLHVVTRPVADHATPLQRPQSPKPQIPKPWILEAAQSCPGAPFTFAGDGKQATLTTARLQVVLSIARGNLSFRASDGSVLLNEGSSLPRTYTPVVRNGEPTFRVTDRFSPAFDEAVYGLGQHQSGLFNYRGATVELGQNNTDVAIPLLVSSRGYALLWNTASLSWFDNRFPLEMKLSAIAGHSIDYYFLYGPEMDAIIHRYRTMTGHAPMLPRWAYGFFQSKDRYVSLDEIRSIADRYRSQHIPLDAMVQDWFWWKHEGDPVFNEHYQDVPGDLAALHAEHVHAMISVWGLMDPKSGTYQALDSRKLLIPGAHVYDATSPQARDLYWNHLPGKLQQMGWDAFWLDSAEPEEYWPHMGDAILRNKQLAIGNGAEFTNIFPFLHTLGVQEHWKAAMPQKRVFLLTRSAFLGQQRVGATVWSGDVYGSYWGLTHQVPAGLNFALSGAPYWTTDIGGYWPPHENPIADPAYQQLYARWFEFGVFCPIFRTHGHRPQNEIWSYDKVEPILIANDRLRYSLMPYIYSLAWMVSSSDYTIQRPLVMDWRTDPKTWNIGDQFLFGPAILVNPVLQADATERSVYLPASPRWYDFWTGATWKGGQQIEAAAPLDHLPLFVRAGSILPLASGLEYADQNPEGPIELRIYPGADGSFQLYDDSGDGYGYERGEHAVIPIRWNDATHSLTLGARAGSFPGMASTRQFRLVLVRQGVGVGVGSAVHPDAEISYTGQPVTVSLNVSR